MTDTDTKTDEIPQRLCSEIQLFELCDQDSCGHKNGRFCSDPVLLGKFEKIAEAELRVSERSILEESDGEDTIEGFGFDDESDEIAMDAEETEENDGWDNEK